jgi:hypothetical protein
MKEFSLQVYAWPSGDLEYYFESLSTKYCDADKRVGGAGEDSYFTNNGAEVCIVGGALALAVAELDPTWDWPRMGGEIEMSYCMWVCDGQVAAAITRS